MVDERPLEEGGRDGRRRGGVTPRCPPPAYSTVLTTLRILEGKGYLRHSKKGRAFIYEPIIAQEQASRTALGHLVTRFFGGSHELLSEKGGRRRFNCSIRHIALNPFDNRSLFTRLCAECCSVPPYSHGFTTRMGRSWKWGVFRVARVAC